MKSTVTIIQEPTWSRIQGPDEAIQVVRDALTIAYPHAQYARSYQYGTWDGTIKFLRRPRNTFPSGLTARVVALLHKNFSVHIDNARGHATSAHACHFPSALHGIILRDYQVAAADHAVSQARLAIQSPTGSGKTEIGAEIIRQIGLNALWVTHRKVLMHQTYDKLCQLLAVPHLAMNDPSLRTGAPPPVNVCMVQTLSRVPPRSEFWSYWRVLIVDECHMMAANTWYQVALQCTHARYRFGLSGTVLTGDPVRDMKLEAATGPIYVAAETQHLACIGFLATPRIVFIHPDPRSFPTPTEVRDVVCPNWRNDPRQLKTLGAELMHYTYQRGVVENKSLLDNVASIITGHPHEKTLVLCTRIEHGRALEGRLSTRAPTDTFPCVFIHGGTPDLEREQFIKAFKRADKGGVLIASTIFDQGIDLPEIDVLVLAGGGKSHITTLQRVGRALRPRPNKSEVLIYDIWMGHGSSIKGDYLAHHSAARETEYQAQGFSVEHRHV